MEAALGLAGRIGSGKTSLAAELSSRLNCPRASFGDHVRRMARQRGLDSQDRAVLQNLGDELIGQGWEPFCEAVLAEAAYTGGSILVDGVRHPEAVTTLRRLLVPLPMYVVGVTSSENDRLCRLADRGLTDEAIRRADLHSNENEVLDVLATADLVLDGRSSPDVAAAVVINWLGNRQSRRPRR